MVKMHIIAGDHLEHERPGELVEDGIRVVVRGGGHVAQTCFRIFSEQIAARVVRTAVPVKRVFYLFLTQSLARHQLHGIFWININYFQSFYHHLVIGDYDCYYWLKRPQHNSSLRLTWAWACSSSCQAPSPDCQTRHCCSWRGSRDLQAWPSMHVLIKISRRYQGRVTCWVWQSTLTVLHHSSWVCESWVPGRSSPGPRTLRERALADREQN